MTNHTHHTIYSGDSRQAKIKPKSIQCVVTSPPYWGLRDYGGDSEIGTEQTFQGYLENIEDVFKNVWRMLRDDGVFFLNIGDIYTQHKNGTSMKEDSLDKGKGKTKFGSSYSPQRDGERFGYKHKDLLLMPYRIVDMLQKMGWYVRSEIIWNKTSSMPESASDRPAQAHEKIFMLTKNHKYHYDRYAFTTEISDDLKGRYDNPLGFNLTSFSKNVWNIPTTSFGGAHFAVFPEELARRAIALAVGSDKCCSACGKMYKRQIEEKKVYRRNQSEYNVKDYPNKVKALGFKKQLMRAWRTKSFAPQCGCEATVSVPTVLDPFAGSGTVGIAAHQLGLNSCLIEQNPSYCDLIEKRLKKEVGLFGTIKKSML